MRFAVPTLCVLILSAPAPGCGTVESNNPDAAVTECPGTQSDCDGVCVDTSSSEDHCGGCNNACAADQVCTDGTCEVPCGADQTRCDGVCTDTDFDPANCGGCGTVCGAAQACVDGMCQSLANAMCDDFERANSTLVEGWMEHTGDFFVDGGRLMTTANQGAYTNHITFDDSTQLDGCATATVSYGAGTAVKAMGLVARWRDPGTYVVGLVQDNTSTGNFNSIWIYEYPGQMNLGNATNLTLGTNPDIQLQLEGTTVTLRVDVDRNGVYDQEVTATTTLTQEGLTGAMGVSFGTPAFFEDFCWGCQ